MQCPKCHQPLQGVDYEGVHLETCPRCGGHWLDADELGSIVKARKTITEASFVTESRQIDRTPADNA